MLNTLILLCSGATVTYAHHAITAGNKIEAVFGLVLTVVLAILFTGLQGFEYVAGFISDGIYGSTFYMATGFHGFHVLIEQFSNCLFNSFNTDHLLQHHRFEAAAFY